MLLLVGAGVANLPIVHALLTLPDATPLLVLPVGLLSMALAWAGGCALQDRRRLSVLAVSAAGAAEVAMPLVPAAREAIGMAALVWAPLAAALSLAALGVLMRVPAWRRARRAQA